MIVNGHIINNITRKRN